MLLVIVGSVVYLILAGVPGSVCEHCTCSLPYGVCEGINNDTCFCYQGYYGPNCSHYDLQCFFCEFGQVCSEEGTCTACVPECPLERAKCSATPEGPQCRCIKGWAGPTCEIDWSWLFPERPIVRIPVLTIPGPIPGPIPSPIPGPIPGPIPDPIPDLSTYTPTEHSGSNGRLSVSGVQLGLCTATVYWLGRRGSF